jgi:hypothetical protein
VYRVSNTISDSYSLSAINDDAYIMPYGVTILIRMLLTTAGGSYAQVPASSIFPKLKGDPAEGPSINRCQYLSSLAQTDIIGIHMSSSSICIKVISGLEFGVLEMFSRVIDYGSYSFLLL